MQDRAETKDVQQIIKMIRGIYVELTPEGFVVAFDSFINKEIELTSGEPRGKHWNDVLVDLQATKDGSQVPPDLYLEENSKNYLHRLQTKSGDPILIEWRFEKIREPNGSIKSIIGIGQDVSSFETDGEALYRHHYTMCERNRILTCLYEIAQIVVDDNHTVGTVLQEIVDWIPEAFEHPERMAAAIQLDEASYHTQGFESSENRFGKDIVINDDVRGRIEVGRAARKTGALQKENAYSDEETSLLDSVARKVAYIVERKEAQDSKLALEEQLRHADRLATIGQLAAGIAHELNNPLGDILGFAQLATHHPDLPEQSYQDLNKIVKSTLYAREVIKKILLFSRQNLPHEGRVNLNELIEEWIDFFDTRCKQNDIQIKLDMNRNLPAIAGDASQLNQVLINLVVNAIHAMPGGGILTITTAIEPDGILMGVQDTGQGIEPEIKDKILLPFFTTKEVNQGTGLGLSVVYGIVNEHGGSLTVRSQVGVGSTFEIKLPL